MPILSYKLFSNYVRFCSDLDFGHKSVCSVTFQTHYLSSQFCCEVKMFEKHYLRITSLSILTCALESVLSSGRRKRSLANVIYVHTCTYVGISTYITTYQKLHRHTFIRSAVSNQHGLLTQVRYLHNCYLHTHPTATPCHQVKLYPPGGRSLSTQVRLRI